MKIILLADSRKNELLVNFCIAYRQLLMKHDLFPCTIRRSFCRPRRISMFSGCPWIMARGFDQLASRAMFNEIDLRNLFAGYADSVLRRAEFPFEGV